MSDSLPDEIVQAIAISNAKSIGEQPVILANLALANQILNSNSAPAEVDPKSKIPDPDRRDADNQDRGLDYGPSGRL